MVIYPMSTTTRHNNLIRQVCADAVARLKELLVLKQANLFSEEIPLVYWGKGDSWTRLVDIDKLEDENYFVAEVMNDLKYVMPDFMLFKNSSYLENERQTRIAGRPDLILEVWSKWNVEEERDFKRGLYSSSEITEHWYIEQENNVVECYKGAVRLPDQNLSDILRSRDGIEFDLTYLAL